MLQVVMITFQQLYQVSRRSRLEPVAAELFAVESIQQTERVIDADGVLRKVVTVVILTQFVPELFVHHTLRFGKLVHFLFKILLQLLVADSANINVLVPH